ncbi:MAG: NAD(P)-dependent oxidoreductase, partial [Alphaproteobacteria bacterium]|nr:NAD(P)-dependent oxidoreductase [Alphaproteobacteria bacterium]
MSRKVAFLGLGVMGFPMAGHLVKAGYDVCVYNRTISRAEEWMHAHEGRMAETPAGAAKEAEIVFACVGADPDVREICLGENGCFDAMSRGAVFVDHTTASAALARELNQKAKDRHLGFVDAPVSGGQAGAENGQLTVMAGGDIQSFEKVEEAIASFAKSLRLLGPAGSGQ